MNKSRLRTRGGGFGVDLRRTVGSAGAWQRAVDWAVRVAGDPLAVYLDTETTGLGWDDEIVDLAIVGADGGVLLDTLVRPSKSISAGASAVHGLRDGDVALAPDWDAVYPRLQGLVVGRVVVVYNADFDRRLIAQCCARCGVAEPTADWQCAMRAFAEFHGESGRAGGFRWQPLERAVRTFDAAAGAARPTSGQPGAAHRALADALACRAVVLGMAAMAGAGGFHST